MKKRLLVLVLLATMLMGCGKVDKDNSEKAVESSTETISEDAKDEFIEAVEEEYLSDIDGAATGEIPDLYYDVFEKYCHKEDHDNYNFASIIADLESMDYTLKGGLEDDYRSFTCGIGSVHVLDEHDYYCSFLFHTDPGNKDDIDNSTLSSISFGHLGIGEIRVNLDIDNSYGDKEYSILENGTLTAVDTLEDLEMYVDEHFAG